MNELEVFTRDNWTVRTVAVDGEPWFVARDVCAALGIQNSADTLAKVLDDDEKGVASVYTPGGDQRMATVNEPGLYSLILRSRKPEAKQFKRWITHEVLPSIRKTGSYAMLDGITRRDLAVMVVEAEDAREAAERLTKELAPAAASWEQLADAEGDYSLRRAAQILSRDPKIDIGQNRLARFLRQIGWCDRAGQPYQAQVDADHLRQRATTYTHPRTGQLMATSQVRVTPAGLGALHHRLGGSEPLALQERQLVLELA